MAVECFSVKICAIYVHEILPGNVQISFKILKTPTDIFLFVMSLTFHYKSLDFKLVPKEIKMNVSEMKEAR